MAKQFRVAVGSEIRVVDETIREFEDWMDVRGLKCKAHHYRGKWHVVLYGQNTDRTTRACFVSHQHFSLACTAARLAFEAGNPVCATG